MRRVPLMVSIMLLTLAACAAPAPTPQLQDTSVRYSRTCSDRSVRAAEQRTSIRPVEGYPPVSRFYEIASVDQGRGFLVFDRLGGCVLDVRSDSARIEPSGSDFLAMPPPTITAVRNESLRRCNEDQDGFRAYLLAERGYSAEELDAISGLAGHHFSVCATWYSDDSYAEDLIINGRTYSVLVLHGVGYLEEV